MEDTIIIAYTDGSCNTRSKTGAWASIILLDGEKVNLSGIEQNTTHNRMELQAGIETIEYIIKKITAGREIHIYTDSQYAAGLMDRKNRLKAAGFLTKKGAAIRNHDLVEKLISLLENHSIKFIKVKAHLKKTEQDNLNIDVDRTVRRLLRHVN